MKVITIHPQGSSLEIHALLVETKVGGLIDIAIHRAVLLAW